MILIKTLKKYAFNESTSLGYFTQDQHISYYYDSYNSERFQIFEVYEEPLYGKTFFFYSYFSHRINIYHKLSVPKSLYITVA